MEYLLISVFFIYCAYLFDIKKKKFNNDYFYYTEVVIISLLFGLRYHIGGDSFLYEEDFESLPHLDELMDQEWNLLTYQPGWYVINALIKSIVDEFWFFTLIHCSIVTVIVFWFINKYTKYRFIASFIFFTLLSITYYTEILRESLSICMFLLSIPYLEKKKWIKYYTLTLLAFSFHLSAIITFFVPLLSPILSKEFQFSKIFCVSIAVLIISFFSTLIIDKIINQLTLGAITTRALFYSNATEVGLSSSDGIAGTNISKKWLLSVAMSMLSLYLLKKARLNNPLYFLVFNISFILILLTFSFGLMANRLLNYFNLFNYVILVNVLLDKKVKYSNIAEIKRGVIIVFFYYYIIMIAHWFDPVDINAKICVYERYYPYSSIINPQKYPPREKEYN